MLTRRPHGGAVRVLVELRVRRLVADQLGVDVGDLAPPVSLVDDLAADSLDLVELALAVEEAFEIVVPERVTEELRTYGELADAVVGLVQGAARPRAVPAVAAAPPAFRAA